MNFANQVIDRCDSTNDLAKLLGEKGFPHGTWISARVQTGGRGRLGRKWESPQGNLHMSVVIRISDQAIWTWVPLAVGVATIKALQGIHCGLNLQLKWPNDIWLNGAKLGGILCEGGKSFLVAGLGLNVVWAPKHSAYPATSLERAGYTPPLGPLRAKILDSILNEIGVLTDVGTDPVKQSYNSLTAFPPGSIMRWGTPPVTGVVRGLGRFGELLIVDENGSQKSLFADDISPTRTVDDGFPA